MFVYLIVLNIYFFCLICPWNNFSLYFYNQEHFFLNITDVPKHAETQKVDRVSAECNKVNCAVLEVIRLTLANIVRVILSVSRTTCSYWPFIPHLITSENLP